jgi:hypothetical protein
LRDDFLQVVERRRNFGKPNVDQLGSPALADSWRCRRAFLNVRRFGYRTGQPSADRRCRRRDERAFHKRATIRRFAHLLG